MNDNVSRVIDSVLPSEFIGRYVRLKPVHNDSFLGLCPFHNEKSPSFRVNDRKRFFYCFGCSKGGDILNFLQDYKSLSFVESLNEIATQYGIKLDHNHSNVSIVKKSLYSLTEEIASIFRKQLFCEHGKEAIHYLQNERKLSGQTIENFSIGYCPKDPEIITSHFPDRFQDLLTLGILGINNYGNLYSVFADRIVFPIWDHKGAVIGFSGRVYKKSQEEKSPKYINSKDSELFKKSAILYNYEKAKKTHQHPILLEGYFDVIMMSQFGFTSTVAQMGTALSKENIESLFAFSDHIIFGYDSDDAGKKAEKRSIEMCLPFLSPKNSISFIELDTKDADEFLRKYGAEKMQEKLKNTISLHEKIFYDYANKVSFNNPQELSLLENNLMEFCSKLHDQTLKKHYQRYFKDRIFQFKTTKLNKSALKPLVYSIKTNSRDAVLFLFLFHNPWFIESDSRLDSFVPFQDKKLEERLGFIIQNPKTSYIEDEDIKYIFQNYSVPSFPDKESAFKFYRKIYEQYVTENLMKDISKALSEHNFSKAKHLQAELLRLKK